MSGVIHGLKSVLSGKNPLLLVCASDIGKVFGRHAREESQFAGPVVAIDGIELKEFNFIDIGTSLRGSTAVPVVIKSLLFPALDLRK